jgi:hypothetical protein
VVPGLFDLLSSDDLCAKLDHDYRRIKAQPSDVFAAFDFLVTAWHLLEWRFPGDAAKTQRAELLQRYPVLGLCEHLSVAGKHFDPTSKKHQSVSGTFRRSVWKRGVWAPGVWASGVWADALVIDLTGAAKVAFGDSITMAQLADLLMDFWRGPGGCPKEAHVSGIA